jgi:hypothetical protein
MDIHLRERYADTVLKKELIDTDIDIVPDDRLHGAFGRPDR